MKRVENAFRITKVGKTAVSVAVGAMLSSFSINALAELYNINDSAYALIINSNPNSIEVRDSRTSGDQYTGALTINITPGREIFGQSTNNFSQTLGIFTSKISANPWLTFAQSDSTLTLNGSTIVRGTVGWFVDYDSTPNNNVQGADPFKNININNSGNTFANQIYADNVNLKSGSSVQFLGNIGEVDAAKTHSTNLNYEGNESTLTFGAGITLSGNITNTVASTGVLVFNGAGSITGSVGGESTGLRKVEVYGGSNSLVSIDGGLTVDHLDFKAQSIVRIVGNLDLNNVNGVNAATFNTHDGTLQLGGDIVGVLNKDAITVSNPPSGPEIGTLTMYGTSSQSVTGHIGSATNAIKLFNVGGTGSDTGVSLTGVSGNVYANTVSINNDSTLTMNAAASGADGYNINGTVVTETNSTGTLILAGGTQKVTGSVGATNTLNTVTSGASGAVSTFTGTIHATNVTNSGDGISNYQDNVTATNVGVLTGISNFVQGLSATTTTISRGTGNFNTNGTSTTSSAIAFTDAGTANLHTGLTGTIAYADNNATVNLWHTRSVSGAVSTTTTSTGILNARGSGVLNSTVGASGLSIQALNVNTLEQQQTPDTFLLAEGHIFASTINLQNDGELRLNDGVDATGDIIQTPTPNIANAKQGVLTALGTSLVTGNVGTDNAALKTINAGVTGKTVTFDSGVVHAETLAYSGTGTIIFNGLSPSSTVSNDLGFVGTVNFGTNGTGTFILGNNVDLITQHAEGAAPNTQTTFINPSRNSDLTNINDNFGSTLTFSGNSVVTGQLGSGIVLKGAINTWGNDTFRTINAGANGSVVTFLNDVYALPSTFNVTGTGVVNFVGDLNSNLVFLANGSVYVADNQNINGAVTTTVDNAAGTGTVNFVGSATTRGQIGTIDPIRYIQNVNFHQATTGGAVLPVTNQNETVNIGHNIYAVNTRIGTNENTNAYATVANITADVFLGNNLTLTAATNPAAASNVSLNTAGAVYATAGLSPVDFLHTKNANGTLTNTAPVTQSTFGTGAFTTNGATLNFAIGTTAWADPVGSVQGAGGTVNRANSSSISGDAGSTLVMNGSETVNLSLLGSLFDDQTYTLIDVLNGGGTDLPVAGNLRDNSFIINTALSRGTTGDANGDLIVTASRAADVYGTNMRTQLGATTHFADPAALRLGTLGRDGQDYDEDMQTVFNMLDIDQWGFGNNQANVATQAQRLSPIANNSLALSAFATGSAVNDSIGMRMHQLRIPESTQAYEEKGVWLRNMFDSATQKSLGQYDGYKSKLSGVALGLDAYPSRDSLVGVSVAHTNTTVKQQDFRLGDEAKQQAWHLSMYAAYNFTPELFVDGVLTHAKVDMTSNRTTAVARTAKAEVDLKQTTAKINVGYKLKLGDSATFLTPFVAWERGSLKQDAYTETGAGDIGLQIQEERLRKGQTTVGLRFEGTTMIGGIVVKPDLAVMSVRDSGTFTKPVRAQFIGDNTAEAMFETQSGFDNVRTNTKGSLGLGLILNKSTSLSLRYETTQRKRDSGTTGEGKSFKSDSAELFVRWNF